MARIDATELLRNQHREAESVFALFVATTDEDTRREMAGVIVKKVSIHAAIEELVFYPALRDRVPNGDVLVQRSLAEHQELKELLVRLDRATTRGDDLEELMSQVRSATQLHVGEEEEEVFPAARRAMTSDELGDLGAQLTAAAKDAPTHPPPPARPRHSAGQPAGRHRRRPPRQGQGRPQRQTVRDVVLGAVEELPQLRRLRLIPVASRRWQPAGGQHHRLLR